MHSIFAPISLDILGKHVFHVQQTNGADLNQIYRIRLYVFSENTENGDFENAYLQISILERIF